MFIKYCVFRRSYNIFRTLTSSVSTSVTSNDHICSIDRDTQPMDFFTYPRCFRCGALELFELKGLLERCIIAAIANTMKKKYVCMYMYVYTMYVYITHNFMTS